MPRALTRLLVVLATLAALLGFAAAPASANPYPWPHNGCTSAPDRGVANFTHACNQHDGCYALHWASRSTCDQWFWNDMMTACRRLPYRMVGTCAATAGIYWSAVRTFGGYFYNSPHVSVRINTPVA